MKVIIMLIMMMINLNNLDFNFKSLYPKILNCILETEEISEN